MEKSRVSFEVFPPKTDLGMEKLCGEGGVLDKLCAMKPHYISCTYGAGGTNVGRNLDVMSHVAASGKTHAVTHFTCIGNSRQGIAEQLQIYLDHGINRLLALRGDIPEGRKDTGGDFQHANELVRFVRDCFGDRFQIAVAGSPEGHMECTSMEADIGYLKRKQDEGANSIITQLCWDMDQFCRWMDAIRQAGIWLPVDAGVMPILDQASTVNMALSRNGCAIPRSLARMISKYWIFPNPFQKDCTDPCAEEKKAAFREAGLEYTVAQIQQYLQCDIRGVHLYALNKYDDVAYIVKKSGLLD